MPFFQQIELIPDDPILSIPILYAADQHPDKVNLGVGAYRDAEGNPFVLRSVQKAERYLEKQNLSKEYLPIDGDPDFCRLSLALALGGDTSHISRTHATQTVGASAALKVAGDFLIQRFPGAKLHLSHPSWANHRHIFSACGFEIDTYPYLRQNKLDFEGMCASIQQMPKGDIILLHASCHNPTGIDPTLSQWETLSELIHDRNLFVLFDMAYQGFGSGLDDDAAAVRLFADREHEMAVTISHSKNFGLYGERVGLLAFFLDSDKTRERVGSHIKSIIRSIYSSPPAHGARIVKTILDSEELTEEWRAELSNMRHRITEMRKALTAELQSRKSSTDFSFFENQKGLFSMTGLNREQVALLRAEHGIYMPQSGRLSFGGLTSKNVNIVADAIHEVI